MSARGAADFLTRSTAVLATLFVSLSIILAVLAAMRHSTAIDTSLAKSAPTDASIPVPATTPIPGMAGSGSAAAAALAANGAAPADNSAVPLEK
jgi:preprotein translocase subunit SecG